MPSPKKYHELKEKGLCPDCQRKNDNGGTYCDECRKFHRERIQGTREGGRGVTFGECECNGTGPLDTSRN